MPRLYLPLGHQPQQPRLFEAARSSSLDLGPIGKDLVELALTETGEPTWPELPPVCLITGEKSNVTFRKVKFSRFPRWVLLLAVVPAGSVVLAGIVALLLTKKASGELPFSDRGWFRWRVARMITPISVFLALGALFVGLSLTLTEQLLEAALAWGVMVSSPLVLYLTLQRNRMVTPVHITDTEIALKIPSEEAARAVLDRLHPGGMEQAVPLFGAAR